MEAKAGDVRLNFELKARDPAPERSLRACRALGAEDRGTLRQRDTFFQVAHGRLKLREQDPGGAELIQYDRANTACARRSRYRLVRVDDPETLRAALAEALGTLVVVEKERRLFVTGNVRIHLDRVEGLGTFVELEAVVTSGARAEDEAPRVAELRRALHLGDDRVVGVAYADLLLGGQPSVEPQSRQRPPTGPWPAP